MIVSERKIRHNPRFMILQTFFKKFHDMVIGDIDCGDVMLELMNPRWEQMDKLTVQARYFETYDN